MVRILLIFQPFRLGYLENEAYLYGYEKYLCKKMCKNYCNNINTAKYCINITSNKLYSS